MIYKNIENAMGNLARCQLDLQIRSPLKNKDYDMPEVGGEFAQYCKV